MLVSFDVKSLDTNIPVEDTLCIIREKLDNDPSLPDRTSLSPASICKLLSLCLKTTSFRFRDTFYKLNDGVAMGSPVSVVVANLFMEHFEAKAIAQSLIKPALWKRFVDDVLAIMQRKACDDFLHYLNSRHPNITFTSEEESDNRLPFMDLTIRRTIEGRLDLTVYRKPTHTEQCLAFNSHHPTSDKRNVIAALHHLAQRVISNDMHPFRPRNPTYHVSPPHQQLPVTLHPQPT